MTRNNYCLKLIATGKGFKWVHRWNVTKGSVYFHSTFTINVNFETPMFFNWDSQLTKKKYHHYFEQWWDLNPGLKSPCYHAPSFLIETFWLKTLPEMQSVIAELGEFQTSSRVVLRRLGYPRIIFGNCLILTFLTLRN